MAYTITQKPTTPNAAYTRLLYTVSGSTNTASPQFQYVMDVYESGSSTLIKRTTQTINPAGVSTFDPSRIIQGELSQDDSWKISSVTAFNSSSKTFTLEFGEQYAASISSSAVIIEGIASTNTEVFRGVVEPNNGIGYNWQSSSYAVLSNMPTTMSMQPDDYGTISVYKNGAATTVTQTFYSESINGAQLVESNNYSVTDNFSSVPISPSTPYWNYVDVSVSSSIGLESYRYEVSDKINNEKTRFAFINKLGSWDYYNNYNPVRQAIDVKREQYTAPRVDYSSLTSTYDISRRGRTDVYNTTDDEFTVDTDYLDKTNANWLEELIESPSVYIQRNGEFIPIVITDSSYTANTNQARQKLFKYTVNFKPSNQPFGTWIPEYVECPKALVPFSGEAFDPFDGGNIDTSSLLYWYDFTTSGTGSMTFSGSNHIREINNKGTVTMSLTRGNSAKYNLWPANHWTAPTYEGNYTQFYGSPDYRNSVLASRYGTYGSASVETGFHAKDITTTIYFANLTFDDPNGANMNLIDYQTHQSGGIQEFTAYNSYNRTPLDALTTASFSSTVHSPISASGLKLRGGQGASINDNEAFFYSYSGSVNGWESRYIVYSGSNYTTGGYTPGKVTTSRQPSETIISSSFNIRVDEAGISWGVHEGLAIGGSARSEDVDASPFKLAHYLMYTGSLTNGQITNIVNSFTGSVSYGYQVNAITN